MSSGYDDAIYKKMTVDELKGLLRSTGNKVSGKKLELIERIIELGILPPEKYIIPRYEIIDEFDIHDIKDFKYWKVKNHNTRFFPHIFEGEVSLSLYQHILDHLQVPIGTMRRFNRIYGDDGLTYVINFGENVIERKVEPWSKIPFLLSLKGMIEKVACSKFTYCVVQYYPSGRIGIKPHRDKEMTPGSVIAGLSLGQSRILRMSKRYEENIDINLLSGSLYVFYPPTNDYWTHSILKDKSIHPRISLTFRTLI